MSNIDLKKIQCFVFDMDGTIYIDNQLIRGSKELFGYLENNNVKYFFLTNNSSKTKKLYSEKLNRLGLLNISEEHIITSGEITIKYVKDRIENPTIYLVGTPELEEQFISHGINVVKEKGKDIDYVVIGFDTTFNYDKAIIACDYIFNGIPLISTNIDLACPIANKKFIPDCGSITKMIELTTNGKSKYIGKPFKETVNYLLDKVSLPKEKIAIVGDRLYTDIATGYNNGICSIGVLTGELSEEDLKNSKIKPDYIFKNVFELYNHLLK